MPARRVDLPDDTPPELSAGLARIRAELAVPDAFPPEVTQTAVAAAASPRLPTLDRTDLELVTIDPPGARDLDQALHLARDGAGYLVHYAIADVAAFVTPGDPVDREAHRRGCTRYAPNRRTPLHPPQLSEDAASLLPGQQRPALLWTVRLDADGATTAAEVVRARVRSRAQLSYAQAQAEIDGGSPRPSLALLAEVGPLREQQERQRGGVSLPIPDQEVVHDGSGWRLELRAPSPVEGWNAQLSLLTGMAAARLMLDGRVGVLRTLPPAEPGALRRLRAIAHALRLDWPAELPYPELVRSLDPGRPAHAALLNACTSLFRGAGYQAFDGSVPEQAGHAALAADYAHCTAPLRRLVDRYALEVCVALGAGQPVPAWVREALPGLPATMAAADRRARGYERAVVDLVEAVLLAGRVGEAFDGVVVEVDEQGRRGTVVVAEPAVEARVDGDALPLGQRVRVRLASADVATGKVVFTLG